MIPLVGTVEELSFLKKRTIKVADECMAKAGTKVEYLIGTMIEVPRAALTADQIAEEAEFFSFGTNDLTQMTFGFSRDDIRLVHAGLRRTTRSSRSTRSRPSTPAASASSSRWA